MKNIFTSLLILLIFCPFPGFCQTDSPGRSFTLTSRIADPTIDSVSFLYINNLGKLSRELLPVQNGEFKITGVISQPTMAYLLFMHKGEKLTRREKEIKTDHIFIEPNEMLISAEADGKGYVYIKGSKSQADWNDLKSLTAPVQLSIDSLAKANGNATHGEAGESGKMANLRRKLVDIKYAYFLGHSGSYVTANQAMFFSSTMGLDSLKRIYELYTPEIKESMEGRRLATEIEGRGAGLPGNMAFQFIIPDKDGKELSLAAFQGKYVLLDFWATWCVPCRASMPHTISLYQKYKTKNFEVIAIGDDDNRIKEWSDAIEHDGTGAFHHALRGLNAELTRRGIPNPRDLDEDFGVRAIPTLILIDPAGKIIGRFTENEDDLDKMLATIYN